MGRRGGGERRDESVGRLEATRKSSAPRECGPSRHIVLGVPFATPSRSRKLDIARAIIPCPCFLSSLRFSSTSTTRPREVRRAVPVERRSPSDAEAAGYIRRRAPSFATLTFLLVLVRGCFEEKGRKSPPPLSSRTPKLVRSRSSMMWKVNRLEVQQSHDNKSQALHTSNEKFPLLLPSFLPLPRIPLLPKHRFN